MLSLYLLRHGQTPCSARDVYCGGGCDAALNGIGQRAAEAVAARLAEIPWAELYTSPQRRALQSLEPLARLLQREPRSEPGLAEIGYGSWDGRTPAELTATEGDAYRAWLADPASLAPPGGETAVQVAARALPVVERIRARHAEGNVLLAAHKTTNRVLLCALLGIDLRLFRARIAQPLAGLSIVTFHAEGPRLALLGDVCHLPPELRQARGS